MTPSHTHDVVVVGASIAGSATATLFARAGARVALVERNPDPDAAMASDPLWGPGGAFALQAAALLVDHTAPTLGDARRLDRALGRYRHAHRLRLAGHHYLMSDFSTGRPYNALERLMFHGAVVDERCADHFAAYGGRMIGVTKFLSPPALARSAWAIARSRREHGRAQPPAAHPTRERRDGQRAADVPAHT